MKKIKFLGNGTSRAKTGQEISQSLLVKTSKKRKQ